MSPKWPFGGHSLVFSLPVPMSSCIFPKRDQRGVEYRQGLGGSSIYPHPSANIPAWKQRAAEAPALLSPTSEDWFGSDTSPTCVPHTKTNTAGETASFHELHALSWANANWGSCIWPSQISCAASISHSPRQCLLGADALWQCDPPQPRAASHGHQPQARHCACGLGPVLGCLPPWPLGWPARSTVSKAKA